jgi:hypothetical protein
VLIFFLFDWQPANNASILQAISIKKGLASLFVPLPIAFATVFRNPIIFGQLK